MAKTMKVAGRVKAAKGGERKARKGKSRAAQKPAADRWGLSRSEASVGAWVSVPKAIACIGATYSADAFATRIAARACGKGAWVPSLARVEDVAEVLFDMSLAYEKNPCPILDSFLEETWRFAGIDALPDVCICCGGPKDEDGATE